MSQVPKTISFVAAVPQFTVPDLVRTAEYYRDVLGFQIAGYWDGARVSLVADTSPVFAIVWRDQVQVFFSPPISAMFVRAVTPLTPTCG